MGVGGGGLCVALDPGQNGSVLAHLQAKYYYLYNKAYIVLFDWCSMKTFTI